MITGGEVKIPLTSLALDVAFISILASGWPGNLSFAPGLACAKFEALADLLLSTGFDLIPADAEAPGVADPVAIGVGLNGILIIALLEGPGKDSQAIDKYPVLASIK